MKPTGKQLVFKNATMTLEVQLDNCIVDVKQISAILLDFKPADFPNLINLYKDGLIVIPFWGTYLNNYLKKRCDK